MSSGLTAPVDEHIILSLLNSTAAGAEMFNNISAAVNAHMQEAHGFIQAEEDAFSQRLLTASKSLCDVCPNAGEWIAIEHFVGMISALVAQFSEGQQHIAFNAVAFIHCSLLHTTMQNVSDMQTSRPSVH